MLCPRVLAARRGGSAALLCVGGGQCREATTSAAPAKLTIQPAIKRTPTELLEALSATVGKDPTAPHFQLIDDPAMIPTVAENKRKYFLAKEMGKRAARQLAAEWPTLFAFNRDQPRLEVFRPQKSPDPMLMEPTEASLRVLMEKRAVKDACMLYERIRAADGDVGEEARDELFKLAAYYNGEDPPLTESEEWPGLRNCALLHDTKWTSAGVADLLYESLPQTPQRKAIMVTALCKYGDKDRSEKLFKELEKENGRSIPAITFAAVMYKKSLAFCMDLLKKMVVYGVRPNESVWAQVLAAAGTAKDKKAVAEILGEIRALKEVPSLRCYEMALRTFAGGDKEKHDEAALKASLSLLVEMLAELEKRPKIEVVHPNDSFFFCTAMTLAEEAGNVALARRIVTLYESKRNEVRLMALGNEGKFYNSYVTLNASQLPSIDDFYNLYIDHVPRVAGASGPLVLAVCNRLQATPHWRLLSRIFDDALAAKLTIYRDVMKEVVDLLRAVKFEALSPTERDEYSERVRRLVDVWDELARFDERKTTRMKYKHIPNALSKCALLLLRIGDTERAFELLGLLADEKHTIGEHATVLTMGAADATVLNEMLDDALRRGSGEDAATCLELMANHPSMSKTRLEQIADKIVERCKLNVVQARIVQGFVRLRPQ